MLAQLTLIHYNVIVPSIIIALSLYLVYSSVIVPSIIIALSLYLYIALSLYLYIALSLYLVYIALSLYLYIYYIIRSSIIVNFTKPTSSQQIPVYYIYM